MIAVQDMLKFVDSAGSRGEGVCYFNAYELLSSACLGAQLCRPSVLRNAVQCLYSAFEALRRSVRSVAAGMFECADRCCLMPAGSHQVQGLREEDRCVQGQAGGAAAQQGGHL